MDDPFYRDREARRPGCIFAPALKTVRVPPAFEGLFERAQDSVGRFFAQRTDCPEQARIEICGQRYMLVRARAIPVEFFALIVRLYSDKGEAEAVSVARSLLFDIAHAMGLSDARNFAERMHLEDPIARLSAGPIHFAHAGWAFVDLSADSRPSPDENFYLLYDHPYSFECDSWLGAGKKTDFPVCVMNAGYSSGWCEASFGVPLVAAEILCRAKGDEHCRFIMAHPTRIEGSRLSTTSSTSRRSRPARWTHLHVIESGIGIGQERIEELF